MILKPPQIELICVEKNTQSSNNFLTIERNKYRLKYPNAVISEPIVLDIAKRKALDAVAIIAWKKEGEIKVYLRSCIRPAVYDRHPEEGNTWELPAGLIEKDESIQDAAKRETLEEIGFDINSSEYQTLGPYSYSAVGTIGEKLHFCWVEIKNHIKKDPICDGSPLERYGETWLAPISTIFEMLNSGDIKDMKTEIGIRRFLQNVALKM